MPGLANHFLNKYCRAMQTLLKQNLPRSLAKPANLQLARQRAATGNEIKRLVDSVRGKSITEHHLVGSLTRSLSASTQSFQPQVEPAPTNANVSVVAGCRPAIGTPADI
jgi:hypothetical protein